mgnify:CR=1 FL=1
MEQNLFNDLLKKADVVDVVSRYIDVTKHGRSYRALCPFHNDKNPSLMISKEKQIFKCFVCGEGGNVINFVQKYEHITYFEAARKVAEMVGFEHEDFKVAKFERHISPNLVPLYKCLTDLASFYATALQTVEGKPAKDYLIKRNIDQSMIKKYQVGYAPQDGTQTVKFLLSKGYSLKNIEDIGVLSNLLNNPYDKNQGRIMFPIHDSDGQVVGFSSRKFKEGDDSAKYINSPETPVFHKTSILYNYHHAKEMARNAGYVYVLEGFMDVFALDISGIKSVVALMGTAFTQEHINLLRRLKVEVRLCLDGDEAGQMAMMKMVEILNEAKVPFRIVDNANDTRDPDDIYQNEGQQGLVNYLENLIDGHEFTLNYHRKTNKMRSVEERREFIIKTMPHVLNLPSRLEVDDYLNRIAEISGFSYDILFDMYKSVKKKLDREKSIVNININEKYPHRQVLNRLQQAERLLVQQMMNYPEAMDFYKKNNVKFTDEFHRYIANYLAYNKEVDRENIYAVILNDINERIEDEQRQTNYRNQVIDIANQKMNSKEFNPDLVVDAYQVVQAEGESSLIKLKMEQELALATNDLERAKIVEKYRTKRRK